LEAVEGAFGADVDYAQIVKLYGPASESAKGRYSPAECTGARKSPVEGNPDPKQISTSFSERSNLTIRMHTRRFARLTNAFSKKVENHAHAVSLHLMYYNFVRIHKTLKVGAEHLLAVRPKRSVQCDVSVERLSRDPELFALRGDNQDERAASIRMRMRRGAG
jgi:hypothetical protein